jgi:Alanine racemase, N-terminal domain
MGEVRLRLDAERWREHLGVVHRATPGLVPVIKGNGYGFGRARLAQEAAALGVDAVAVGVAKEVPRVRGNFGGDVVIMQPWDADDERAQAYLTDPKVITTVSRLTDLEAIADTDLEPRVLVEVQTSMRRHGIRLDHLGAVTPLLQRVRFEGWSLHLPLRVAGRYAEAEALTRAAVAVIPGTLWLSHLPPDEASQLADTAGSEPVGVRLRVGTRLWLGAQNHRQTVATVLDVHPVRRGERAGYRGRRVPADGWVVVVAGGTAHGIGLEAPTSAVTLRQRAVSVATGSLEAAGLSLSPYTINGKKRWFLEPPHMQSSQIFLPRKETPPAIGDEVPVELRLTTANVDSVAWDL